MEINPNDYLHPLLEAGDCHSYYTSRGSEFIPADPYGRFNVCHYTGDTPEHTESCLDELSRNTGISREHIIIPTQTHSANVCTIDSIPYPPERLEGCDGLVTSLRNVAIGVNTADCLPVVLLDPVNNIAGVAHAGWRGALSGVIEATVEAMKEVGAVTTDIRYAIGPSICRDCFEVGEDVASKFPPEVTSYPCMGGKPHVDLQTYIGLRLSLEGIALSQGLRWNPSLCTRHNPQSFFSARAIGTASGRVFTFAVII